MSKKEIEALFIRSKHEPYRRCGFQFSRAGYGIALELLTDDQVEQLKNDPHLVVEECTFPAEESDADAEKAAKEAEKKAAAEKAAAEKAAKAAEQDALKREKAAIKADPKKWEAAIAAAIAKAELTAEAFAALPAADRVARIEAEIVAGDAKDGAK